MREEASLFQPDVSLPNKVSIAVDKEQDFYDRPGRIPYVWDLESRVCFLHYTASRWTHFIIKSEKVVIDQESVTSCGECSKGWSDNDTVRQIDLQAHPEVLSELDRNRHE